MQSGLRQCLMHGRGRVEKPSNSCTSFPARGLPQSGSKGLSQSRTVQCATPLAFCFVAKAASILAAFKRWACRFCYSRASLLKANPTMVTLHKYISAWGLPDISPFCSKLEIYLRMAGWKYTTKVSDSRYHCWGKAAATWWRTARG